MLISHRRVAVVGLATIILLTISAPGSLLGTDVAESTAAAKTPASRDREGSTLQVARVKGTRAKRRICGRREQRRLVRRNARGRARCIPVPRGVRRPRGISQQGGPPQRLPKPGRGLGAGPGGRELGALAWAKSQLGSRSWNWYCERFVEFAYGTSNRYRSAWAAASSIGLIGSPPQTAPAGTLMFFGPHHTNGYYGHVGISLGDGRMISGLSTVRIDRVVSGYWRSLYRGWNYAPRSWPGRIPPSPSAPRSGFRAYLDAQFPMASNGHVYVTAGDSVPFGFNLHFSRRYSPGSFVLRPAADSAANVRTFSTIKGDFHGDTTHAFYRANVVPSRETAPGLYGLKWDAIDRSTGEFGGLQPSLILDVYPVVTFTGPVGDQSIPSGGSRTVTVSMRNNGGTPLVQGKDNLHFVDSQGHDLNYPYCGAAPEWVTGNSVLMNEPSVPRGGTATYRVKVCGMAGYHGSATLRLQYVREGVAHYRPILPLALRIG